MEKPTAYWVFQWCPQMVVIQGVLTSPSGADGKSSAIVEGRHLLGRYQALDQTPATSPDAASETALRFAGAVQAQHPDSIVELYHKGESCSLSAGNSGGPTEQRTTVVVIHPPHIIHCRQPWAKDHQDYAILSVMEPHTCHYVMHVCSPPSLATSESVVTEEEGYLEGPVNHDDYAQLNQMIQQIRETLHVYLWETTADKYRKANPGPETSLHDALPPMPHSRIQSNIELVKDMFQHAYDSYMYNAFPAAEVKPITCRPSTFDLVKIPGLTLIDSLDTLILMGNFTEFARAVERLRDLHYLLQDENQQLGETGGLFAQNQNVSVFETNIRILGGLLSAHQLAETFVKSKVRGSDVFSKDHSILIGSHGTQTAEDPMVCMSETEPMVEESTHWVYDGFLLSLAQDLGDRLLPAFSTNTGIPFGTVNLLNGIPEGETTIASLAGGGTLSLEMELLSRLTGNPDYGKAAKLATRALWMRRSDLNLVGKHICTHRGVWTETLSGIGSNSDSFYEYLIKHHTLFPEDPDFWVQMTSSYSGIYNETRLGEWYGDVDLFRGTSNGGKPRSLFEALAAFYPGMQILLGEVTPAATSLNSYFLVREFLGFLPERFNVAAWRVEAGGGKHFLRPELLESAYFLHRATRESSQSSGWGNSGWLWAADFALHALQDSAKSSCGYTSLNNVSPVTTGKMGSKLEGEVHQLDDMPSFFLSETLKYLFLTFDDENMLHVDRDHEWVFTTEAHPFHHVGVHASDDDTPKAELESMKSRLIQLLERKSQGTHAVHSDGWDDMEDEKWTVGSSFEDFLNGVAPVTIGMTRVQEAQLSAAQWTSHGPDFWESAGMLESVRHFQRNQFEYDFFGEIQTNKNAAHTRFSRSGSQISLTNSCPNYYLPDLFWVQAINGGSADYNEAYVSSIMTPEDDGFAVLGSMDALALLGSGGVHPTSLHRRSRQCPLKEPIRPDQAPPPMRDAQNNKPQSQTHQFGDMGEFEVSAFQDGVGFYVRRIESDEIITATLVQDTESGNPGGSFAMVYSTNKVIADGVGTISSPRPNERSVVMSDLNGHAFNCVVTLFEVDMTQSDQHTKEPDVIAHFPCSPALFGSTHMSKLISSGGLVVEGLAARPRNGDEYGCGAAETLSLESDYELVLGGIQLVQRGVCTFEEKAMHQMKANQAKAVLVVNHENEELFVMSGGGADDPDFKDTANFPATVLLSGADGNVIHKVLDNAAKQSGHSEFQIKISLDHDRGTVYEENGTVRVIGNQFWPHVRANGVSLEVFVSGGWGVKAIQKQTTSGKQEWQLYILQHDVEQIV
eukprot:Nitzschia sp. Nitz4//scaffold275_size25065//4856//8761//NITZ4_008331-RA/size25065-processed-gene-0.0-mRNA-1//1//CDS//3329545294//9432//frame0